MITVDEMIFTWMVVSRLRRRVQIRHTSTLRFREFVQWKEQISSYHFTPERKK